MSYTRVLLGSANPAKRRGVELALARAFPVGAPEVRCLAVASGVEAQPWGDEATRRGAVARARAALEERDMDAVLAVGIEGGVAREGDALWSFSWAAVEASDGGRGVARSAAFLLPPRLAAPLAEGEELGDVIDRAFGVVDARRSQGAVGLLTRGALDRAELHAQAVLLALMPVLRRELFG